MDETRKNNSENDTFSVASLDPGIEKAAVGWALLDSELLIKMVEVSDFLGIKQDSSKIVFECILESYSVLRKAFNAKEILGMESAYTEATGKLKEALSDCQAQVAYYSLDTVKTAMRQHVCKNLVKKSLSGIGRNSANKSAETYEAEAVKMLQGILRNPFSAKMPEKFGDIFVEWGENAEEMGRGVATLGCAQLDLMVNAQALCPDGKTLSLLPGTTTAILAPTGTGKTTFLVTAICANLKLGKNVLLITHEMTGPQVKSIIRRCMHGQSANSMVDYLRNPENKKTIIEKEELIKKNLTFLSLVEDTLSAEACVQQIKKWVELKQTEGNPYHLVVDDYPGLLQSTTFAKQEARNYIGNLYRNFVKMARAINIPLLVSIQTNREASKKNARTGNHQNSSSLVDKNDMAESFQMSQDVSTVLTLNRTPNDILNGTVTILCDKTKSTDEGSVMTIQCDYSKGRVFEDDSGAYIYNYKMAGEISDMIDFSKIKRNEIKRFSNSDIVQMLKEKK
jgi:hypothetical protein